MLDRQKTEFAALMKVTRETYDQSPLSPDALRLWWSALNRFDIEHVRSALDEHIRLSKFSPRPADILDILDKIVPDGRPSVEEAWAMIPRDEYTSVVMTEEMAKALRVAQPLLDEGDQVAARMAFKDAYTRLVDTAKRLGELVKWLPSLGQDKESREACLAEAIRLGRLKPEHAISLLPPENAVPLLEAAGEKKLALAYKPTNEAKEKIAKMKEILSKSTFSSK